MSVCEKSTCRPITLLSSLAIVFGVSDFLYAQQDLRHTLPRSGMRPEAVFNESMIPGPRAVLPIIENGGQLDESSLFHAKGYDFEVRFGSRGLVVYRWRDGADPGLSRTELNFQGASTKTLVSGVDPYPGVLNFIKGNDESRWAYGLTVFRTIQYEDLYPGVTLSVEGRNGRLLQTFELEAGVDPAVIRIGYSGPTLRIKQEGALATASKVGGRSIDQPSVVEWDGSSSRELEGRLRFISSGELTFEVPDHRPDRSLVIKAEIPVALYDNLAPVGEFKVVNRAVQGEPYFTYLGGTGIDFGRGVDLLKNGDVIVALQTNSVDLPVTEDAIQSAIGDNTGDAYLIRFNPSTGEIIWATYYGSDQQDYVFDLACLEEFERCAVVGSTLGTVPGAALGKRTPGDYDAYITLLDSETGGLGAVLQDFAELDGGNNAVTTFGPSTPCFATGGFVQDPTGLSAILGTSCLQGSDWENVTWKDGDETYESTVFEVFTQGESICGGGAGDPARNNNIFGTAEDVDNYFACRDASGFTGILEANPGRSWYANAASFQDEACVASRTETNADGEFVDTFAAACFVTASSDLPTSYTARTEVYQGSGPVEGMAFNSAGDLFINWHSTDADGARRVFGTVVDAPGDLSQPVWNGRRSWDVGLSPESVAQVHTARAGLSGVANLGSGLVFEPVSPTAPEEFQNLPPSSVAGTFWQADVLGYLGIVNLEGDDLALGLEIPNVEGSTNPAVVFTELLEPGGFAGGFPYPLGADLHVSLAGRGEVDVVSFNVLNFFVADGDDSFNSEIETVPERESFVHFINASPGPVNASARDLGLGFDEFTTSDEIEPKTTRTVPRPDPGEAIIVSVTDVGSNATEEYLIDWGASSECQGCQTLLVVDDVPSGGKSAVQTLRLLAFDLSGAHLETRVVTAIQETRPLPATYRLSQNYPNPFNPDGVGTTIPFELLDASPVRLTIVNALGQRVWRWSSEQMPPGKHTVSWDGGDLSGRSLPSGLYLYRFEAGEFMQTRTMSLIR